MKTPSRLTKFKKIRDDIIGIDQKFETPFGKKKIHYFDWTASGRLYSPIEKKISGTFGPFVGNTHSESTETGADMTISYEISRQIIKRHFNSNKENVLLMVGNGTTGAIAKLQRLLGLKFSSQSTRYAKFTKQKIKKSLALKKPVVFISEMEHHSNQTTWLECDTDVVLVPSDSMGVIDTNKLELLLIKYKNRNTKIGSFSACSNVTGILNPIEELARVMHKHNGLCFVDFAAAAPYLKIDINPKDKLAKLDAMFFSPHKFLGGPGTSGVLIFDKKLYFNDLSPESPGGGTVKWTDPWEGRSYYDSIETREDGGTPAFLQTIKTALCIKLKEEMGTANIIAREEELLKKLLNGLKLIPNLHVLGNLKTKRLGIVSFYIDGTHYNLIVKLLNDRFGIQTRGGCSCAGTYGHVLMELNKENSNKIMCMIDKGNLSTKPGWVRVSLHPTLLDEEVDLLINSLKLIVKNYDIWKKDYVYSKTTNEFTHKKVVSSKKRDQIETWF